MTSVVTSPVTARAARGGPAETDTIARAGHQETGEDHLADPEKETTTAAGSTIEIEIVPTVTVSTDLATTVETRTTIKRGGTTPGTVGTGEGIQGTQVATGMSPKIGTVETTTEAIPGAGEIGMIEASIRLEDRKAPTEEGMTGLLKARIGEVHLHIEETILIRSLIRPLSKLKTVKLQKTQSMIETQYLTKENKGACEKEQKIN